MMPDTSPVLRAYARWRAAALDAQDPVAVQERTLLRLVARAANTRFGRDHDFARVRSVADFQERVPLRAYDAMWHDYWAAAFPVLENVSWPGRTPFLALSSGTTTGRTKYLPVTREMTRSNRAAGLDVLVHHARARPRTTVFGGASFMLGGSTALTEEAPGVWSGDLSGIAARTLPVWIRPWSFPGSRLATLADWNDKIERLAEASLDRDIRVLTGVPAWVLELLDRVAVKRAGRAGRDGHAFPKLELFVHGGVNFAPYRTRFERRFAGLEPDIREVYPASEGFVASADRGYGEGLRLNLDHGLFFEFVPVDTLNDERPVRHWMANLETGVNYAIVLSTCAGLFGYVLGDTVRLVDRHPARLLVTGRTAQGLSFFGEHLIVEEIEAAVALAAAAIDADVTDFAAGAAFAEVAGEGREGHLFLVEFAAEVTEAARIRFAAELDAGLARANDDYRAHRAEAVGIAPPRVRVVAPGGFALWMESRGKRGGQHKVPRAVTDPDLWRDLVSFLSSGRA